jgi:hypothetical protein
MTTRLTESLVSTIRRRYDALPRYPTGRVQFGSLKKIAQETKVSYYTVRNLVAGRTYRSDSPKRRFEAMEILLRLLQLGKARFYEPTGEFCFGGIMYSARDGDWSVIVNIIGWDKARADAGYALLNFPDREPLIEEKM